MTEGLHIVYKESKSEKKRRLQDRKRKFSHKEAKILEERQRRREEEYRIEEEAKQDEEGIKEEKKELKKLKKFETDNGVELKNKQKNADSTSLKRTNRSCGTCSSCLNNIDCGSCDFCSDMKKYGGPGRLRQKCRARQCLYLSRVRKRDGDVMVKEECDLGNAKMEIDTNFEMSKRDKVIKNKQSRGEENLQVLIKAVNDGVDQQTMVSVQQQDHCYSAPDPSKLDLIKNNADKHDPNKLDVNKQALDEDHFKKKVLKVKRATGSNKGCQHQYESNRKTKTSSRSSRIDENIYNNIHYSTNRITRSSRKEKERSAKQCLGPGCVNAARSGSKYCSNDCGVQLQIRRLKKILPLRKASLSKESYATKVALEKIKELQLVEKRCQDKLLELDEQYEQLEILISKSSGLSIQEEEENEEEKDSDLDLTTYCVSCGIPLGPRIAFKHMEKCWAKVECLMSFGAAMKSAGSLFCDTFMNVQGTYCKRLKVMCPEHYKEPKVEADVICGCPLVDDNWKDTEKLCRISRRKCTRHLSWHRLRRGEIDLSRVRQWWKLEDALEQERQLRIDVSNRNDIVGVLLNSTIDHTQDNKLTSTVGNTIENKLNSSTSPTLCDKLDFANDQTQNSKLNSITGHVNHNILNSTTDQSGDSLNFINNHKQDNNLNSASINGDANTNAEGISDGSLLEIPNKTDIEIVNATDSNKMIKSYNNICHENDGSENQSLIYSNDSKTNVLNDDIGS